MKALTLGPRRGQLVEIGPGATDMPAAADPAAAGDDLAHFETFDLVYRALCALLYNYVPLSGHPGGSISSGRIVAGILYDSMDYDPADPDCESADMLSYAAGHKALGLYAMWALRNEILRVGAPHLLPRDARRQFRLEDLLGFRRNPTTDTPLMTRFRSRALDGHPTPATPFVRLATGASGVGLTASIGLALGARDYYGAAAPRVHILEGEGGLTPGRAAEALAAAGTAGLANAVLHVDWNQASIDSDRVCRDATGPGDYVQWDPAELAWINDWNVVRVVDGMDFGQVLAAQRAALAFDNGQPTAVVYRTTKGWRYGMEGRASHGVGHGLCTDRFHEAVAELVARTGARLSRCDQNATRCHGGAEEAILEECFWEALLVVRRAIETETAMVQALARRLGAARERLAASRRAPRAGAPRIEAVFETARHGVNGGNGLPPLKPGTVTTLRGELGRVLNHYNRESHGALLAASADLLGSTSVNMVNAGFPEGFYHARSNPNARLVSTGGICEDAMIGILGGLSTFGRHVGVGSSYGAFIAALGHIPARLHAIGAQARKSVSDEPYRPFILVCAHAGLKTGEDGPTHADPQALQLLEGNFPPGTMITLTPWEPQEIAPLMAMALSRRPAVVAPFVTRPNETVLDRRALGLAPAEDAVTGMYQLRRSAGHGEGTVVLQESGVAYAFVSQALPLLEKEGLDLNVYYVASAELFDALPEYDRQRLYPEERAREAIGITGFTLPTMHRWILSERGRAHTLHPFRGGRFLGSGPAAKVLAEAGLDGESQFRAVLRHVKEGRVRVA